MKTCKVVIEETCAETFELEIPDDADMYDYVREQYYNCKIVLEPGECQSRRMKIYDSQNNSCMDWEEF